ncbi:MAG: AAA family ATPase [Phycisphaerae bacterium]
MKLVRIHVENFRSIDTLTVNLKRYTSLIGPNNSGKSTLLRAIEIILNQETPEFDEWRKGGEDNPIIIEAEFDEIQEWERTTPGIAAHVYDNRVQIRMTASVDREKPEKPKAKVLWQSYREDESIEGWSDTFKELTPDLKDIATKAGITAPAFKTKATKEQLRSLIRKDHSNKVAKGTPQWTDDGMSIPAALQQALPQAQLIPAVRDANEDSQPGAKTSFGILLDKIILPAIIGSLEYQNLLSAVDGLKKILGDANGAQLPAIQALAKTISDRVSQLIAAKVVLDMEAPDAKKFVGGNALLRLNDGTATRISLQGHGLQRALVFAMLEILAAQSAKMGTNGEASPNTRQTVLLFEEPELFMHPHLMRRLKDTLTTISDQNGWQVIVSTHSPFLVDIGKDPCSLVIHRRDDSSRPPSVTQIAAGEDPFLKDGMKDERDRLRAVLDFHPTVCEAFFAKHVLLVEGDTEIATSVRQPELYKLAGLSDSHHRDVTVVSCDGKWTIIPIARLLKAFGISTRIIHDQDRKGKTEDELAANPTSEFNANKRIAEIVGSDKVMVIDDTFEDVLWEKDEAPHSKNDKPYRAWKRVQGLCDGKTNLDHAPKLREVVLFAFGQHLPPSPS